MSLISLVDNTRTDKNTSHSYLPVYERLFSDKKDTATHVLEIGIALGGSIKLWNDYFPEAKIIGVDIYPPFQYPQDISNKLLYPRIHLYSMDAYGEKFPKLMDVQCDIIIDDGPHTLESQIQCLQLFLPKLKPQGILIIEDIQDYNHVAILQQNIPKGYTTEVHDLRNKKNRPDDILFIVHKI